MVAYGIFDPPRTLDADVSTDALTARAVSLVCLRGGCCDMPVADWCARCIAVVLARRIDRIHRVLRRAPGSPRIAPPPTPPDPPPTGPAGQVRPTVRRQGGAGPSSVGGKTVYGTDLDADFLDRNSPETARGGGVTPTG